MHGGVLAGAGADRHGCSGHAGARNAPAILAAHGLADVGSVAQGIGVVAGLCLWGFGLWWLALATLTIRYWRAGVPFNLGWWGYTFPLGVYTVATFRLGTTLNLGFFGFADSRACGDVAARRRQDAGRRMARQPVRLTLHRHPELIRHDDRISRSDHSMPLRSASVAGHRRALSWTISTPNWRVRPAVAAFSGMPRSVPPALPPRRHWRSSSST
jgi:hypothetical protein